MPAGKSTCRKRREKRVRRAGRVKKGWKKEGSAQGQDLIDSPQRQLFLARVYCQLHRLRRRGEGEGHGQA